MPATTAIAEIALVSDISGVCNSGDTRRITSKPRNVERRNTKSFGSKLVMREAGLGTRGWGLGDDIKACTGAVCHCLRQTGSCQSEKALAAVNRALTG